MLSQSMTVYQTVSALLKAITTAYLVSQNGLHGMLLFEISRRRQRIQSITADFALLCCLLI
ncbi:MAG: hypothetical protein ACJASB_001425 [Shewanella psychromarinicola]|jgi:hypothetical protein|uniref:hypothetical protein n=1 Tax=Shewanella psychromarinicola TaxID=2487742 RepID=UPI003EEA2AC2